MWRGVFPAVTTKFTEGGELDLAEMERCFGLQVDAGVDGIIVCGSLGENMTLEFVIWDTNDHQYDSLVILDDFKWDLNPATVGTIGAN